MRSIGFFFLTIVFFANYAHGQHAVRPVQTHNQGPLVHFFAIPTNSGGAVLEKNAFLFGNYFNIANNATSAQIEEETIYLDGEMYRNELVFSYGLFTNFELGVSIPVVKHSGGVMDAFISNWHEVFNLPGKSRVLMPTDELAYFFMEEEEVVFEMNKSKLSIGDITFSMGLPIVTNQKHDLSLRSFLKVPSGNKNNLVGSGTWDFGAQLAGTINSIPQRNEFSFYYSGGYLRISKGALLQDKLCENVGFGSFGLVFNTNNHLYFKSQIDFHSSFYGKTNLKQLGKSSAQLVIGTEYFIKKEIALSLAFAEDIIVNTAPDFVLQFGITFHY
ncbi:hypothetical protein BZG02_09235 [Labilibaculum filiforme]|uniref:DUF3187 family protein n=1 Tax=Labilibaculum filiforme TaxID=1940526 RepID=A0A2N3HZS4_9BACT|nr:DUF3187 family protein [Labilibaculum filiforme]PKQ63544.1 hypothetical protein BZG02_09235 [Labilibaculum filiforme]